MVASVCLAVSPITSTFKFNSGSRYPIADKDCVLLPSKRSIAFERGLIDKIIACLITRFGSNATAAAVRRALPGEFEEWARLRIANDGDTIRATAFNTANSGDKRDASFIRVCHFFLLDKLNSADQLPSTYSLSTDTREQGIGGQTWFQKCSTVSCSISSHSRFALFHRLAS